MLYVTVGKVGIAEKHMVFDFLVVDGYGAAQVGDGIIDAVEFQIDFGTVVVEVVVFGVFVDFDVKHIEDFLVGHVVCRSVVMTAHCCHKQRQKEDDIKDSSFH